MNSATGLRFSQRTLSRRAAASAVEARPAVARAVGVHKSYFRGPHEVPVLRGVDLSVQAGEFLAIVGQSGSGKSTLLHLLGTLDAPDRGEIHFHGARIDHLPRIEQDRLRNQSIGMIFQFYHLLPELTALENVLMPAMIADGVWRYQRRKKQWREKAEHLLELVGLSHRRRHRPREMSGGEMQRAAIARALLPEPALLIADEPTGNLDEENGRSILELLRSLNRSNGLSIVMVTHDSTIARDADRSVRLVSGRVEAC